MAFSLFSSFKKNILPTNSPTLLGVKIPVLIPASTEEIEVLRDIKLKVYWDMKQWVGVGGNIQIPDGSIQTIGLMKDLPEILKAKALIVHKDIKDYKELRFERMGEYTPMGLRQNRYFGCMWKRV
jgi:hypothetical protein